VTANDHRLGHVEGTNYQNEDQRPTKPKLPTWNEIAGHALTSLDEARLGLSAARDWMNSDWPEGARPC